MKLHLLVDLWYCGQVHTPGPGGGHFRILSGRASPAFLVLLGSPGSPDPVFLGLHSFLRSNLFQLWLQLPLGWGSTPKAVTLPSLAQGMLRQAGHVEHLTSPGTQSGAS